VQFTDTDKKRSIYNGNAGTITGLDARTGQITARLDAASGAGRSVTWSAHEFEGFRHGYAGTIYKGQGKTLDRTYLYHTEHWRSAASYVALTRQRDSAQVFVARETARDTEQLARQMARGEVRAASVAWATRDEVSHVRAERQAEPAAADRPIERPKAGQERDEDSLRAKVRAALAERQREKAEQEKPEAVQKSDGRTIQTEHPANPAAYWTAIATGAGKDRDEDRLRAKVRAALDARQREGAGKEARDEPDLPADAQRPTHDPASDRAQLRETLQSLDRSALAEMTRADRVDIGFAARPMTVEDAARLVSRDYAAAADHATELRKATAEVAKAIDYNERVQRADQTQGNQRWQAMGFVRQVMHKSGARKDQLLSYSESSESQAVSELQKLDVRRAELAQQLAQAEKAEVAAFGVAKPAATVELAQRQERAGLARDVLAERRQQELAQERQQEHTQHRNRGLGR
jgi:hypothetical protein